MAYKRSRKDFEADLQKQASPFVLYGTPLPPLDDDARDDGSYVPVWKQEVTDDRGRKRLHGAFTGGFSAGYFNSVGSKEGWTPTTFVSSRANRAKDGRNQAQQRPEDFMDEEDMREQEESRQISTNDEFAGFGTADDANHKNTLMDLFRPAENTRGIKLLNKMGWKLGHGIGPRVKRRADPDDESSEVHLHAPEDVSMLAVTKKSGHNGLGFADGADKSSSASQQNRQRERRSEEHSDEEDESRPGLKFASQVRKSAKPKRGAFGVGVLNDTGSDDEDPYSMGPRIAYNRTLGGDKKLKKGKMATIRNANPLLKNTPVFVPTRIGTLSNALRKCHDGRLPLDGFVLADELVGFSTMSLSDDKYKPPPVPEGWKPSRLANLDSALETSAYQSTAEAAKASAHTSKSRGTLLGEPALPGKSVFDYLTPAVREKLMKTTGKTNLPPALGESLPGTNPASSQQTFNSQIPIIDSQTALQALSRTLHGGFTPYPNDATKAARYKTYLESQANVHTDASILEAAALASPLLAIKPSAMTNEDFITELNEFARAAEVFKPMSGLIASRFTTSASSSSNSTPQANSSGDQTVAELLTKPASRPKDPSVEAASMGMFGLLTRSSTNFYPTRLLCKRFGVPLPSHAELPQSTSAGVNTGPYTAASDGNSSNANFQSSGSRQGNKDEIRSNAGNSTINSHRNDSRHDQHSGEDRQLTIEAPLDTTAEMSDGMTGGMGAPDTATIDPDKNEALEQDRPGAAVFRAIFGDSDDEDEDEDDE